MVIRILSSLGNRRQWIDFCRRETPYCYIEHPDTLVDFQSCHLQITLLNQQVRNGKEAVKYSIGARHSLEPAWNFIKACRFSLEHMVRGLEAIDFQGNARDNSLLGVSPEVNIRKFFAKEQAVISPSFLGPLEPLPSLPEYWDIYQACRLLANDQFADLQPEHHNLDHDRPAAADVTALLLSLLEQPDRWRVRLRNRRLWLLDSRKPKFSLVPKLP